MSPIYATLSGIPETYAVRSAAEMQPTTSRSRYRHENFPFSSKPEQCEEIGITVDPNRYSPGHRRDPSEGQQPFVVSFIGRTDLYGTAQRSISGVRLRGLPRKIDIATAHWPFLSTSVAFAPASLRLLAEDRFPRIWVPTAAERDARQLLLHRHKLVRVRTQVKNQLQALALNQGVQRKRKLWSEAGRKQLESLPLLPWASRRRAELLQLLDQLEASIGELDRAVAEQAHARAAAQRLMTHPGVGPGHGASANTPTK